MAREWLSKTAKGPTAGKSGSGSWNFWNVAEFAQSQVDAAIEECARIADEGVTSFATKQALITLAERIRARKGER